MSNFRTLLCQIRPVEVIHERELQNSDIAKMLKNSPLPPVITVMPPKNSWGVIKTCTNLERYLGQFNDWPDQLKYIKAENMDFALMSLGMATAFLEDALIVE